VGLVNGHERPQNVAGFLANISMALDGIDYSLGALVAMARFQIMSETGVDPLEGSIYQNHGFDTEAREPGEEE
jgi:hypothetical protein